MSQKSTTQGQIILRDSPALGQITVDMESFFTFSFWLAEELEDMVAEQSWPAGAAGPRSPGRLADDV